MFLPQARTSEIVVQSLGKEILVYDLKTNQAYNLNETSSLIFNACDGSTTFEQLKKRHQLTDDLIYFALDELQKSNLITGEASGHFAGMSRREVIRKVGLTSMVALPVIAGIVAPGAAAAASVLLANNAACTVQSDTRSTECQSSHCLLSNDADGNITSLRCCSTFNGFNNRGTTGYIFGGSDQNDCDSLASTGTCCSGMATFQSNTCTCT